MPKIKHLNQTENNKDMTPFPTRAPQIDKIQCDCGCTFFEEIKVQQFPRLHNLVVGQQLQPLDGIDFFVIKCVHCGDIIAPQVMFGQQDVRSKRYDEFIAEIQKLEAQQVIPATDGETV